MWTELTKMKPEYKLLLVGAVVVLLLGLFWNPGYGSRVANYDAKFNAHANVELFSDNYLYREDVPTMTLFYVDWCGHCKKVKPTWNQFMDKYKSRDDVNVVAIDCEKHKDLAKRFNISGYPTIKIFPRGMNNDESIDYVQNRDLASFSKYLESLARKPIGAEGFRNSVPKPFNSHNDPEVVEPFSSFMLN